MKPGRYSRRRRRSQFRRTIVTAVAAAFLLCAGLVLQGWRKHQIGANRSTVPYAGIVQTAVQPAVLRDPTRRTYPFSIVRGGAFSKEELLNALDSDPVAASHYQLFQLAQLRTVRSTYVKPVYVSYRKDDRIFWTSHPIYLHEGETLLTDGTLYARARCGNRISLAPQAPVAHAEPLPEMLDKPEPAEAIPQPLLQAAVEFEPTNATLTIGPEDFALPENIRPPVHEAPETVRLSETVLRTLPVLIAGVSSRPGTTVGVTTEFPGPYPLPPGWVHPPPFTFRPPPNVLQPIPEPSGFVLISLAVSAFVLISWRRHSCLPRRH